MQVLRTAAELAPHAGCCLVPTMGALHRGHVALIERGLHLGPPVVVTIFVNPTQFGPGEDLARYPRTPERDLEQCRDAGATAVFMPDVETIYPCDAPIPVPPLPPVAVRPGLEDACRPGHFAGVAQVVARLFDLARPACAVFGEKDFQQLRTIQALVTDAPDRWPGLAIVPAETIREPDGLALSSRNAYLSPSERERAVGLAAALRAAQEAPRVAEAETRLRAVLDAHDLRTEYAVVRDADTLQPLPTDARTGRALVAARLGSVRLIDNAPWMARA